MTISAIPVGVAHDGRLRDLIALGAIIGDTPIDPDQIQPASLDLRLGGTAYRLRASFLPGTGRTVADRLAQSDLVMHSFDLHAGAVLERGCVYLVQLQESLRLPLLAAARANPKSSTGRIDVFVRVIGDGATGFDDLPVGYDGPLYVEISPCTFSILARTGDRLCQLRVREGTFPILAEQTFSVDLTLDGVCGWRARRHAGVLDLARIGGHDKHAFFEPLSLTADRPLLVLDPGEFYILASQEAIQIPPDQAAEMAPIATDLGEFRAHYAGFFDPGFGTSGKSARAVLEVRCRDVPFVLEHGQKVGKLVFEPMVARPERLYGEAGSNYQGQGLRLSKHFAL